MSTAEPGPNAQGELAPLPSSFWQSWQVTEAAAQSPGAVVAVVRRAYGLRQDELGARAGFSQSTISRLESGGNLAYDLRVLRALQQLLGIPPALLGLADPAATGRIGQAGQAEVERARPRSDGPAPVIDPTALTVRNLCPAATAFAVGPAAESCLAGIAVGPQLVSQLLVARKVINDASSWRRSGALRLAGRQLYDITDNLRRSAVRGEVRRRLLFVSAVYAELCGWLQEESGDLRRAGTWTARALQHAQAADDRNMVAYAYTRMSAIAAAEGDPDRVIGLARAALREPDVRPRVRAFALYQAARGYACRSEDAACLAAMDEAVDLTERAAPENGEEYVVGDWINKYHMETERAARLLDLGRISDALAAYEWVRPHWNQICPWLQGLHTAKIAVAHAAHGDFTAAAAAGFDALLLATSTGSAFVLTELRNLEQWAEAGPIAELRAALHSIS